MERNTQKKYIVKGRIREYVKWGKRGQWRRGAYQFLPNTEIVLSVSNSTYNPRLYNRFWVRGQNRSGLFTTKGLYFKYLTDLKVEEVDTSDETTLAFIKKNDLLFFNEQTMPSILDWLDYFEEVSTPERLNGEITDDLFLRAQDFLRELKEAISNGQEDEVVTKYLKFPMTVRHYYGLKKDTSVSKERFTSDIEKYFWKEVCASISNTNPETIFPTESKMIIGNCEVEISNETEFKVSKIIYSNITV